MKYIARRAGEDDSDEDVDDLVLLDTTTGHRRRLATDIAWFETSWSSDGRRVRFGQRYRSGELGWREVDVETGSIEDVEGFDVLDGAVLPGTSDCGRLSPAGRWIAYRDDALMLRVARADGSDVFALDLPFPHSIDAPYWSPRGMRLAVNLTAVDHTGAYVIDLRSGGHLRVSPPPIGDKDWPRYHVSGWSADGEWVVVTKNHWHDPRTYDYEWNDIWLLAADGSAVERVTDDGRCKAAVVRPTGEIPATDAEQELTFAWAHALRRADDPPGAGEALAALIRLELNAVGAPFAVLLMVRTTEGVSYPTVATCETIADGFSRLDAFLQEHDYRPSDTFTVSFPRYATDDLDEELATVQIAHLILDETKARRWAFDREVPAPPSNAV